MKKYILLLVALISLSGLGCRAQSLLNQTSFTPLNFSSNKEFVNLSLNNGDRFAGNKITAFTNGKVMNVSYLGTLYKANGERYVTLGAGLSFTQNFGVPTNVIGFIWRIATDGSVYRQKYENGRYAGETSETRPYQIVNECIDFPSTASTTGYYGGYSSGSSSSGSSSGGSSYDRHKATCAGCSGTGKCSLCNGRGYNDRLYKCSRCNGSGTCQSCYGNGYIRGTY